MKVSQVTSRRAIRTAPVNLGHFTMMLMTCADGSQMIPMFIWSEESCTSQISTSTIQDEVIEQWSPNGYMTRELFQTWFTQFRRVLECTVQYLIHTMIV